MCPIGLSQNFIKQPINVLIFIFVGFCHYVYKFSVFNEKHPWGGGSWVFHPYFSNVIEAENGSRLLKYKLSQNYTCTQYLFNVSLLIYVVPIIVICVWTQECKYAFKFLNHAFAMTFTLKVVTGCGKLDYWRDSNQVCACVLPTGT